MARCALVAMAVWLALAGPARAQDGGPSGSGRLGSLTIFSQPAGAVFEIEGRQLTLTGRTPWTVARGLEGVFEVRSLSEGYEEFKRTVYLDPTAQDTLRVSLTRKTPLRALWRSAIIPGWGQGYSGRKGRGIGFFGAAAGAGIAYLVFKDRYDDAAEDVEAAFIRYRDENDAAEKERLFQALEREREEADDADRDRDITVIVGGVIYAANLFDAYVLFPRGGRGLFVGGPGESGLLAQASPRSVTLGTQIGY